MTEKTPSLADLFTVDMWEDFDSLPLPLQAFEVRHMKQRYEQYSKRYQRNSGALSIDPEHIWGERQINYVIGEVKAIKATDEFRNRQKRKGTEFQAYVILTERLFEKLAKKQMYVEKNWKTLGKSGQKKIIERYAKAYQAAVRRHKDKKNKK